MNTSQNIATLDLDLLMQELTKESVLNKENNWKIVQAVQTATISTGMSNIFKPHNPHYKIDEIITANQAIIKNNREILINEINKKNKTLIRAVEKISIITALLLSLGFIAATHI